MNIAVVIPCYKVRSHVLDVIAGIGPQVAAIYCVDDACPDASGSFISENCRDARLRVLYNATNCGVGGAVLAGYRQAVLDGAEVIVKVDGDGQMDPALIPRFVRPIVTGEADYTKGNRFFDLSLLAGMPVHRRLGNLGLSFLSKASSGYWDLFDPTNGYTAISAKVIRLIPLDRVATRYFFESDMLFRLSIARARVIDVPMPARYSDEVSGLSAYNVFFPFALRHIRNIFKRIGYNYFLRDFNIGSIELVFGSILFIFGVVFGITEWVQLGREREFASAGTVMVAALPIIIGFQLLLGALSYDIEQVPRIALHPLLNDADPRLAPNP